MNAPQLDLQAGAGDGVERAEGLVHQHGVGIDRQRARQSDPLLLTTGELGWIATAVVAGWQTDQLE